MPTQDNRISSADLAKHFGLHADRARRGELVRTTKYGRDDLVLLSAQEYDRLKSRERRVYGIENIPQKWVEAIAKAEPPAGAHSFDHEVPADWESRT
jgi:prevent-host-death family protein